MEIPPPIHGPTHPTQQNEKGGWLGPLFAWEIIREARRGSGYLPRMVYAVSLLLMLFLLMKGPDITLKEAAQFGENAFNWFLLFQYLAVLLLTPVYVAGTFIEDRQQGILPLLMTTYLTPRELVVGKMMGRLVPMLGVLLAGVPVLAILQLFGGISFGKLVFHTVNVLILLLVVGMHAIRSSTLYGSVGNAVFYTCFRVLGSFCAGYILAGTCSFFMQGLIRSEYILMLCSAVFMAVNLWLGRNSLLRAMDSMDNRPRGEDRTLPERSQVAVRNPVVLAKMEPAHSETDTKPSPEPAKLSAADVADRVQEIQEQVRPSQIVHSQNPPVYQNWPIIWKQMFFPDRNNLSIWSLILATTLFLYWIVSTAENLPGPGYHWMARMLMSIVLFMVMFHTAGSLALERTQRTLLSLRTTPMSLTRIVIEFAWGSIWRYRWLLAMFMVLLFASVLLGQPACLLWYPLIFFSQLACYAMLALVVSMVSQTAFQARLIVSVIYFITMLVLPKLFSDWSSIIAMQLLPYAGWELLPSMLLQFEWQIHAALLCTCLMFWLLTLSLFMLACLLLRRLVERA